MSALTDREACRIYAQTRQHRYRVAKTLTIIEKALITNNAWLIAVSGGKDSTVVMNCVRLVNPDIPAVCSVYEWMLPETRTYVQHLENCERGLFRLKHELRNHVRGEINRRETEKR